MIRLIFVLFLILAPVVLAEPDSTETGMADFNCPDKAVKKGAAPDQGGTELKCLDEKGRLQGPYKRWYPNGQLMIFAHYKDGLEHGEQQSWYPNGQMMARGISIQGKRYQGWEYWTVTGQKRKLTVKTEQVKVPAEKTLGNSNAEPRTIKPASPAAARQPAPGADKPLIYRQ